MNLLANDLWGRARELDAARAGLEGVKAGQGASFAIVGEPGIGKTRLATELAQRAGLAVYWGRAWEAGGAPAYWPWRQLLEAMQPGLATSATGPLAVLWSPHGSSDFSTSDPRQARFELFDAVVRVLREQALRQPMLCVLDDLHAADVASLELAAFVTGALTSSPIAWVMTWRDAEAERLPVRDVLARVARRCTVLQLPRLSREDTGSLVHALMPSADVALGDSLFHATSGNPLFLCETVRALAAGRAAVSPGQLPVAQGVALVVRDRVDALSPAARALVEHGAALGREVPLDLLAAAAVLAPAAARPLAAELVAAGLWNEQGPDRWLFSHALVRDALYRGLSDAARADVQASVTEALDARVVAGRAELSIARALHALEAQPKIAAERVVPWVLAAAQQARAQHAYEEGITLLERASRELVLPDAARAELLLALGWAYGDLGSGAALQRTFDEAIAVARRLGNPALLGRAVLGRGSRYVLGTVRTELIALIDEALAGLPDAEVALRARLWARKASAMTPAADPTEALALARRALVAVEGSADPRAVLNVAVAAGSALGEFAPPAERATVNTVLVRTARELSDRVLELRGLSRLVTDHLELGDLARADAVLLERDALATSLGHPRFRWVTPLFGSMRSALEGRFDESVRAVEEARRLVIAADDETGWRTLAVHQLWVLLLQDRVDALRALEPELLRRVDDMTTFPELIRAMVLARSGHPGPAREHLRRAAGSSLLYLRATHMLAGVAETAVACGELDTARLAYELLQPHADSNVSVGLIGPMCGVPVRALLGLLGHALGRRDDEIRPHFDAALERTAAMGARAHEVWVRLWLGQYLTSRPAEVEAGRQQLARCAVLARASGMEGVAARAEAVQLPAAQVRAAPKVTVDFTLRPHESGWRLERGTTALMLKDLRGMGMLARLLERPGEEVHALELVGGEAGAEPGEADAGDAGEVLDEKARQAYRRRISQLSDRIEDAEARGDARRAEAARTELEALSRELARAVGIGGRVRRAGSSAERARVTAQRRLREAIKRIAELDPEVGGLLERTVRTGTFCAYEPQRRAR